MKTTALIPTMQAVTNGRGEWDVLRTAFNTLENTFFNDPFFDDFLTVRSGKASRFPKMDLWESETAYEVEVNVAGLEKDEVNVEFNNNYLTLSGGKKNDKKVETGKYLLSELSYKKFYRQIPIPGTVNEDGIEAKYDNGILRISLPKLVKLKPDSKKIEIK